MRITSTTNASAVQHEGTTYTADDDGIFEVPQHVGEELTGFPDWPPEHEAAAIAAEEQRAQDNDVTRLAARVAELEAWRASLDADEAPAKRGPGRPRKTAADTE
jgi:hypothetical protein